MDTIILRSIDDLKEHPKNRELFGDVHADPEIFSEIKNSILYRGLQEPLIVLLDGTILSGHVRLEGFIELANENLDELEGHPETLDYLRRRVIPVRVHDQFETKEEEITYLIFSNTQRRQLTPTQRNSIYRFLKSLDIEKPLTSKGGRPSQDTTSIPKVRSRVAQFADEIGKSLKTLKREDTLLSEPALPLSLKDMVDKGKVTKSSLQAAVEQATEYATREGRSVTEADILISLDNPIKPPTVAEAIKGVVKEDLDFTDLLEEVSKRNPPTQQVVEEEEEEDPEEEETPEKEPPEDIGETEEVTNTFEATMAKGIRAKGGEVVIPSFGKDRAVKEKDERKFVKSENLFEEEEDELPEEHVPPSAVEDSLVEEVIEEPEEEIEETPSEVSYPKISPNLKLLRDKYQWFASKLPEVTEENRDIWVGFYQLVKEILVEEGILPQEKSAEVPKEEEPPPIQVEAKKDEFDFDSLDLSGI
jgi:hypothetical protein